MEVNEAYEKMEQVISALKKEYNLHDTMKFIIVRLMERANEAQIENVDCFNDGRALAYYEMLDIIQHELEANDEDLMEFGLETDVDELYL